MKFYLINIILLLSCFGCNSQTTTKEQKAEKTEEVQKISVLSSSQIGSALELVSDDNLVWRPFIVELSVEKLQGHYGNIFRVDKQRKIIELRQDRNRIVLLQNESVENAENLAEYHHTETPRHSLKEVEIFTPSIQLQYGIQVGMSKQDFFKMLNFSSDVENSINVIKIFDPLGEMIEQSYVFNDGKLVTIKMNLPY